MTANGPQTTARFGVRLWSFPTAECVLLPVGNTTAERLAEWIAHQMLDGLRTSRQPLPTTLRVSVEENVGQWATATVTPTVE